MKEIPQSAPQSEIDKSEEWRVRKNPLTERVEVLHVHATRGKDTEKDERETERGLEVGTGEGDELRASEWLYIARRAVM